MTKFFLIFGFIVTSAAWAKPAYLGELAAAYAGSLVHNTTKCQTCHNNGRALNAFGSEYSKLKRSGLERNEMFKQLGAKDSDEDGRTNLEELLNGLNPGKADPEAAVAYYFGKVEYAFADGRNVESTSLVKRVVDPVLSKIVELVSQPESNDSVTELKRIDKSNEFTVIDKENTFSGKVSFMGTEWQWSDWNYDIVLTAGGTVKGLGHLDENGITTEKKIANAEGSVTVVVKETLTPISEEEYKDKKQ